MDFGHTGRVGGNGEADGYSVMHVIHLNYPLVHSIKYYVKNQCLFKKRERQGTAKYVGHDAFRRTVEASFFQNGVPGRHALPIFFYIFK